LDLRLPVPENNTLEKKRIFALTRDSSMNDFQANPEYHLKKIKAYIARMPSLSTTVIKVLETCNDPNASAYDLKRVISLDPVLTGRVLKLINSAYYSLGCPVSSLTRAIILLGINNVKNLALSFAILDNLTARSGPRFYSADEFWTHSLGVGVVAKALAALKDVPSSAHEELFIAGLLHDLGKLPLQSQLPTEYYQVGEAARRNADQLHQSEMRLLGIDHCAVGRMIATKWRLNLSMIDSLSHHHHPEECPEESRGFVSIVSLANLYANAFKIGNAGNHTSELEAVASLSCEIGVEYEMLANLHQTVLSEIDKARVFLEVLQNA
jgi:HD-like signal output (HDOD) protein